MLTDPSVVIIGIAALALGLFVLKQVADVIMRLVLAVAGVAILYGLIIYFDVDLGNLSTIVRDIGDQIVSFFRGIIGAV